MVSNVMEYEIYWHLALSSPPHWVKQSVRTVVEPCYLACICVAKEALARQSSPSVTGLESLTQKTPLLKTGRTRNH